MSDPPALPPSIALMFSLAPKLPASMPSRRRVIAGSAAAAAAAALPIGGARSQPISTALLPSGLAEDLTFAVIVAGMTSGSHSVSFHRQADRLIVRNRIDIVVAPLGLRLFEYQHRSEETFVGDRLVEFDSETLDDDSMFRVHGRATAAGFEVIGRRGTATAASDILVASFWTPAIFSRDVLIDPQRGTLKRQTIHEQRAVTVTLAGRPVAATRYRVSGIVAGSVDYGSDGRWLGATFQKKAVDIVYRPPA